MIINIKHSDYIENGAFVLNEDAKPFEPYKSNRSLYVTQNGNCRLKDEIIDIITKSTLVIKICSFIITDHEIFELILNKAKTTNTVIFILTQLDRSKLNNLSSLSEFLTEEEATPSSSSTHLNNIKKLYDSGVHIRASESAHAKFIIADRNVGFLTSANLTTPSLNENTESGVYLNEKSSQELDKLFDIIYLKGTNYTKFTDSSKRNKMFVSNTQSDYDFKNLPQAIDSDLRFTYEDKTSNLLEEIVAIISNAKEYIYLSTYSIVGLEHINVLVLAIENALKRGVDVFIFCRGMNYRNDHLYGTEVLARIGCIIFGNFDNHSKGIISENEGMIFTANIDGNHGLVNGFEVGYKLDEYQRQEFLSFHKYLIENSNYKFKLKPQRMDLTKSYIIYEKFKNISPPLIPSDIIIVGSASLLSEKNDFMKFPIFYSTAKNSSHITVGNYTYDCAFEGNTFTLLKKQSFQFNREKYLLKFFNLKIELN